jgi:hypothetical protein
MGFSHRSGQTKEHKVGICCFSTKGVSMVATPLIFFYFQLWRRERKYGIGTKLDLDL